MFSNKQTWEAWAFGDEIDQTIIMEIWAAGQWIWTYESEDDREQAFKVMWERRRILNLFDGFSKWRLVF